MCSYFASFSESSIQDQFQKIKSRIPTKIICNVTDKFRFIYFRNKTLKTNPILTVAITLFSKQVIFRHFLSNRISSGAVDTPTLKFRQHSESKTFGMVGYTYEKCPLKDKLSEYTGITMANPFFIFLPTPCKYSPAVSRRRYARHEHIFN